MAVVFKINNLAPAADPIGIVLPVPGFTFWHDPCFPKVATRRRNLVTRKDIAGYAPTSNEIGFDRYHGNGVAAGATKTGVMETKSFTFFIMVRLNADDATAGLYPSFGPRLFSTPTIGVSIRHSPTATRIYLNSSNSGDTFTITHNRAPGQWSLLMVRYDDATKLFDITCLSNGVTARKTFASARSMDAVNAIQLAASFDAVTGRVDIAHVSIAERAITDAEVATVAELIRARCGFYGITE